LSEADRWGLLSSCSFLPRLPTPLGSRRLGSASIPPTTRHLLCLCLSRHHPSRLPPLIRHRTTRASNGRRPRRSPQRHLWKRRRTLDLHLGARQGRDWVGSGQHDRVDLEQHVVGPRVLFLLWWVEVS